MALNFLVNLGSYSVKFFCEKAGIQLHYARFRDSTHRNPLCILQHCINRAKVQLNQDGNLKHFLTIEGLSKENLTKILDTAQSFLDDNNNLINRPLLEGRTVMNLFFENSTRTRTTF